VWTALLSCSSLFDHCMDGGRVTSGCFKLPTVNITTLSISLQVRSAQGAEATGGRHGGIAGRGCEWAAERVADSQ
jgi:hypothetical protein